MAGPVFERSYRVALFDHTPGYTGGATKSFDVNVLPGFLIVHVGLARVQALRDTPVGAAIGISEYTAIDDGGRGRTVTFADPATWGTAFGARAASYTVSAIVTHGEMTGWWYHQVWT